MGTNNRHPWLGRFIELVLRRPGRVIALAVLLAAASSYWISDLGISTSRHSLVAPDNPYQIRMLKFIEAFGAPEMPIFVISGGTQTARRNLVDALTQRLDELPLFKGRVLGHMGPQELAEALLLQDLSQLSDLRLLVPPEPSAGEIFERWRSHLRPCLRVKAWQPCGGAANSNALSLWPHTQYRPG